MFLNAEEVALPADLKSKIANNPHIRFDDRLAELTQRWKESPINK